MPLTSQLPNLLGNSPLFMGLSPLEIQRLIEIGRIEHWKDGACVLEEGQDGSKMMVILEGRADIHRQDSSGNPHRVGQVNPGDMLGEMSLLLERPRTASATAIGPLTCFTMERSAFSSMVEEEDPAVLKLCVHLSRLLASRILDLNERVVNLLSDSDVISDAYFDERQRLFTLWEY